MYDFKFGEANCLPCQPFDPGSQVQVFALNFLSVTFANFMLVSIQMACISAPIIGVIMTDTPKGSNSALSCLKTSSVRLPNT